jgi:hypothetical protein
MKTLKLMLASVAFLFVAIAANAAAKPANDKPTKDDVVNMYIDAVAHGKTADVIKYLDDNMQFSTQRGENVNTLNRDQFVDYLKANAMDDPSVKVTSTITQGDDSTTTMKVDFAYADYTRTDVVSLTNSNGWVITSITSTFK